MVWSGAAWRSKLLWAPARVGRRPQHLHQVRPPLGQRQSHAGCPGRWLGNDPQQCSRTRGRLDRKWQEPFSDRIHASAVVTAPLFALARPRWARALHVLLLQVQALPPGGLLLPDETPERKGRPGHGDLRGQQHGGAEEHAAPRVVSPRGEAGGSGVGLFHKGQKPKTPRRRPTGGLRLCWSVYFCKRIGEENHTQRWEMIQPCQIKVICVKNH